MAHELGGKRRRIREQMTSGVALSLFYGLEDQRLLLRAHAFQSRKAPVSCGRRELVDRPDVQRRVEQRHGLRPDPLQAQQVENGRRKLLEQLLMVAAGAGVDQLADLGREILADARELAKLASSSRTTASPHVPTCRPRNGMHGS